MCVLYVMMLVSFSLKECREKKSFSLMKNGVSKRPPSHQREQRAKQHQPHDPVHFHSEVAAEQ